MNYTVRRYKFTTASIRRLQVRSCSEVCGKRICGRPWDDKLVDDPHGTGRLRPPGGGSPLAREPPAVAHLERLLGLHVPVRIQHPFFRHLGIYNMCETLCIDYGKDKSGKLNSNILSHENFIRADTVRENNVLAS